MAEVFFCSPMDSSAFSESIDLSPSVCAQTGHRFYDPLGLHPFFALWERHSRKGSRSQTQSILCAESARQS